MREGDAAMKIAALVLGILGAIATAGLGSKWVSDYNDNKALIDSLSKVSASIGGGDNPALAELNRTKNAGYLMIVFGIAALGAAALVFKQSKAAGGVLVAAAVIPALLAPKSLVFSFFLIIAGVLAFLAKPKTA
jgi:hypothetical protein